LSVMPCMDGLANLRVCDYYMDDSSKVYPQPIAGFASSSLTPIYLQVPEDKRWLQVDSICFTLTTSAIAGNRGLVYGVLNEVGTVLFHHVFNSVQTAGLVVNYCFAPFQYPANTGSNRCNFFPLMVLNPKWQVYVYTGSGGDAGDRYSAVRYMVKEVDRWI